MSVVRLLFNHRLSAECLQFFYVFYLMFFAVCLALERCLFVEICYFLVLFIFIFGSPLMVATWRLVRVRI